MNGSLQATQGNLTPAVWQCQCGNATFSIMSKAGEWMVRCLQCKLTHANMRCVQVVPTDPEAQTQQ